MVKLSSCRRYIQPTFYRLYTSGNDTLSSLFFCRITRIRPICLPPKKIGVNSDDSIGMQGFIIAPGETVLKRMGPLFLASFFLIIITTACYIYLIRTILRQKTIAQIKK